MKPLATPSPREVGQYRVIAELGRGGMGQVLLGSGPDGRLVALKLVHAQFAADDGFRARFRREVDASRAVSGAYTAAVVDADPDAPTPWLASVFVPGPSLHEVIQTTGALPEQSVLRLAAGLATALIQIHRADLVHRDLKPSNVLLTDDGPRVIDFGIVRAVRGNGAGDLTRTGWLIGSPAFMSPEQANGEPVTPASDVFSLGSVIVAAAVGNSPFNDTATLRTLNNVVQADPDLSGLPTTIRDVVAPCLAKDPTQRPAPAELLDSIGLIAPSARPWPTAVHQLITRRHADVARILDLAPESTTITDDGPPTVTATRVDTTAPVEPGREPGTAESPNGRPTAALDRSTGSRTAQRWVRLGVPVVVVALAGVLVWILWPSPQTPLQETSPPPQTSSSTQTTSAPQIAEISAMTGALPAEYVEFSPDGRTLAMVSSDNAVMLWDVASRRQVGQIINMGGESDSSNVAFSPDGRTLITAKVDGGDSVVQQWEVASGRQTAQPLVINTGHEFSVKTPALSRDGGTVAVMNEDEDPGSVRLWDVAGRRQIGRLDTGLIRDMAFSPDGRIFVTTVVDDSGTTSLSLWDITSRQRVGEPITAQYKRDIDSFGFSSDGRVLMTTDEDRVRLWDTATYNQIRPPITISGRYNGHTVLSPDGRRLAALISGGTIEVWDVDNSRLIDSASTYGADTVAFSPDGRTLSTAGDDTVRLWSIPSS
ncbi:WD40 repeat domain-containing serine/threonine protein kinase [Amycolatopsis taiwanensis]|uniref:Protein kinase domain-containing protein n=1 Tax=Amycolatopsis taiwanensis TaxID=342230 RepID=A0A9W6R0C9_9PSEU|nr:protein kinase [Amycolatopsis taiwanensis]GLY67279.1 hypothetical protein Atai01_38980 [Amycolatopsis taiwanensis]